MPKNKKRAVPADIWLDRATAAQKEKMKAALGFIQPTPINSKVEEVPCGASGQKGLLVGDIPRAYAVMPVPARGGVPAWELWKVEVKDDVVVRVEKGVESLRGVILQQIEDDILRDA